MRGWVAALAISVSLGCEAIATGYLLPALAQDSDDVNALNAEIMRLYQAGKYEEAISPALRALAVYEKRQGSSSGDYGRALAMVAELYRDLGRITEAEDAAKRALSIAESAAGDNYDQLGSALFVLSSVYRDQNRFADAERLIKRLLSHNENAHVPRDLDVSAALTKLADLYNDQERYAEAEPLLKHALAIEEAGYGHDNFQICPTIISLANIYEAQSHHAEAEQNYERALGILKKQWGEDHPNTAATINDLAAVYRAENRTEDAESLFKNALRIYEKKFGPDHPSVATVLNNLAALYTDESRYAEAGSLYTRSLHIFESVLGSDHPNVGLVADDLARLKSAQGEWTEASELLRRSSDITIKRTKRASADIRQPITSKGKSETARNIRYFTDLVKVTGRLAPDGNADHARLGSGIFETVQWAFSSEAAQMVAQMAARVVSGKPGLAPIIRERQDLMSDWQAKDKALIAAKSLPPDKRDAASEKMLAGRLSAIDVSVGKIDVLLEKEFPEYTELANPEPLAVTGVQASLHDNEALVLLFDTPEMKPTPEETFIWVVTKTDSRWFRSDLGTAALTDKVQALRCGLDEAEWDGLEKPARCAKLLGVGRPGDSDPLPFSFAIAHELYASLLGPAKDLIKGKRLLIVPSGPLTSLPFQVLVTEPPKVPIGLKYQDYRNVAWLAREQATTVLPSVASLKSLREFAKASHGSGDYVGYGNPVLQGNPGCRVATTAPETCPGAAPVIQVASTTAVPSRAPRGRGGRRSAGIDHVFRNGSGQDAVLAEVQSLCPLPDTAEEIRCVAKDLGIPDSEIHLGPEATEAGIKELSASRKLASYKVIHFATHGLLAGDVEAMAKREAEPALVLTPPKKPKDADDDGLLTASEVTQLKLNADWVILSACNTAAGDKLGAEALSGLARAFFYAGARALLVSHWPVYSDAAVRLITDTFTELKTHPDIGRAEAERRAMVALIDDPSQEDNAHPSVWAPFVVVGEGGVEARP